MPRKNLVFLDIEELKKIEETVCHLLEKLLDFRPGYSGSIRLQAFHYKPKVKIYYRFSPEPQGRR